MVGGFGYDWVLFSRSFFGGDPVRIYRNGNADPFRQGYRYRQRVPAPIQPMQQPKPSLWARLLGGRG